MNPKKFTKILLKNEKQVRKTRISLNKMIADSFLDTQTGFTKEFMQSCIPTDRKFDWLPREFVFEITNGLKSQLDGVEFLVKECNGSNLSQHQLTSFENTRNKLLRVISTICNHVFALSVDIFQRQIEDAVVEIEDYFKELIALTSGATFTAMKVWKECKNEQARKQTILIYSRLEQSRKSND